MRKTALFALTLLFVTAALLFSGCDLLTEPFPEETGIDSSILIDPEKTQPVTESPTEAESEPYAGLTETERAIREIADTALSEAYTLPAWEHFRIRIDYGVNGNTNIYVRYEFRIYGYHTYESYEVTLNADMTVKNVFGSSEGKYSRYLATVTEEAFRAAEGKIGEGGYLTIDNEGYLCMSREDIVSITPETDESGNEIMEGCGDHKHVFTNERICPAP